MVGSPEVLFVCVHNAGRSQMAAGLLAHHGGSAVRVTSAGSAPAHEINPAVRQVMAEIGIDLSREFPKKLTVDAVEAADVVITMGCGDACPVFPGKRYLDWRIEDPAGQGVDAVRPIRDEIDRRVRELLAELAGRSPATGGTLDEEAAERRGEHVGRQVTPARRAEMSDRLDHEGGLDPAP